MKPANIYIFALIIVALTMVVVLAISFGLDYYTAEVLRWSPHEQRLILFSGGAVLWAILLLLWVRAAEKKASLIGLVYLILPALVIWKYATGDQNLF